MAKNQDAVIFQTEAAYWSESARDEVRTAARDAIAGNHEEAECSRQRAIVYQREAANYAAWALEELTT